MPRGALGGRRCGRLTCLGANRSYERPTAELIGALYEIERRIRGLEPEKCARIRDH